jgi:cysteine desulfurase/selenocysteine lyase
MSVIEERENQLVEYMMDRLLAVDGLRLIGEAKERASLASFTVDEIHASDVGTILDKQGIAIRTGHHCAQTILRRFDVPATARASLSFYNTRDDIDRLIDGIKTVKSFFQ